MASDAWARVDAVLRENLPLLAEEWPEDIPVLVNAVLLAAGPSEDEAQAARERDEARHEAAMNGEAIMLAREAMGAEGGIAFFDDAVRAVVKQRDEARAEAEKLRETLASVGVPLEALRLANRDVPGWLSREAERAIVEATDAIRGALSGGGGQ